MTAPSLDPDKLSDDEKETLAGLFKDSKGLSREIAAYAFGRSLPPELGRRLSSLKLAADDLRNYLLSNRLVKEDRVMATDEEIISLLERNGPMRRGEIAEALGVKPNEHLTRQLSSMVRYKEIHVVCQNAGNNWVEYAPGRDPTACPSEAVDARTEILGILSTGPKTTTEVTSLRKGIGSIDTLTRMERDGKVSCNRTMVPYTWSIVPRTSAGDAHAL